MQEIVGELESSQRIPGWKSEVARDSCCDAVPNRNMSASPSAESQECLSA